MAALMSYRVVVTREDGSWLAEIPDLQGAHTFARTLPALDRAVREVIVLADDLPDEAIDTLELEYDYRTGNPDLDATTAKVRKLRAEADALAETAAARTAEAAVALVAGGLGVRDVAALLRISPQRVSQITGKRPRTGAA
jgi:hypothetical protein